MNSIIKILVIPFLSITISYGQMIDVTELYPSNKYFFPNFENIGEKADLPHYRISSLAEDDKGYLWIGTKDGGLIRYDGYTFYSFELDTSDPFSLSSNDVFFVFKDSRNMLWIGTDNALSYFHPYNEQFLKVGLYTSDNSLEVPRNMTCITEAKNGNLLIGTNIGIFEISNIHDSNFIKQREPTINHDSTNIRIKHILLQDDNPLVAGKIIKDIQYDTNGKLWILSESELGTINYDSLSLNSGDYTRGNKISGNYKVVTKIKDASRIYIDEQRIIWINTLSNIFRIVDKRGSIKIDSIEYGPHTKAIDDFISSKTDSRKFWVGHSDENLKLFDEASEAYYLLTFESNDINNLHDNGVSCFLRTRSNAIILGTSWGGLYKFNPNSVLSNFHPELQAIHQNQTNNLRYVYEDSKGFIWMIAEDIYRCNKNTGEILATYNAEFFNHLWSYTNIILEDNEGRFWIGMESRGLVYLDIKNDFDKNNPSKWTTNYRKIINNKTITALTESDDGTIWAGTIYRDLDSAKIYTELFKFNHDGDILSSYAITQCLLRNGNETDQFINQIYVDNNNVVWLATGYGLVRLSEFPLEMQIFNDIQTNELVLGNNRILTVCPDPYKPDGILWLGTANRGLYSFDIKNSIFRPRNKTKVLPTNHIASILSDEIGDLWLGTDRGITKVVIDSNGGSISKVQNFHTSDGLVTNDFTNYYGPNAVKTKNDQLIFTGPRGFQIIEPENIKDDSNVPAVYITNFTINYNPANFNQPDSPLDNPLMITDRIVLPHNKNTLGFEMTALDFKSPEKLSYAFMLENYNNNWIYNKNKRTIQYTKLPPGKYKLKVKVANRDGVWSESLDVLDIKIKRPWWSSYTAYAFYILIFIAGVWSVDRFQRNKQKIEIRLEKNKIEADKLRDLDLMKSKFFANISHEFKTPLTLIMNPVEEMLTKQDQTSNHNSLLMIKRNAKRLQQYISEILELSRLDANRIKLSIRELDIVKFIKYMISSFESLAHQKDISIKLKSTNDEIICYLDPEKLNIIMSNLLSNAIKFTPEQGKIEISISGCLCNEHEHCSEKKGCLTISVRDTGIGISEEKIPFIFDRYYKINQNETGTGLGLALVKELVNLHNGTINVISQESRFTSFQLQFPMAGYHIKTNEIAHSNRYEIEEDFDFPSSISTSDTLENETIESSEYNLKIVLVIEDNKDMRTLISSGLKREYQVIVAKDGEEGISMAIKTSPDLILCDIMMPKKDGFEVTKTLKTNEITSHIPIIMLTARSEMSDKLTGLETGADDYLIKPFHARELKTRVSNLLKQRDKLREKFSKLNILKLDKLPNRSLDQVFLEKVASSIEANMSNEDFGVQMLTQDLNISRTQLHRKIKALVNQSTNELIQSIRLQKASEMLINKSGTVAEICYKVGFSSPPYFTRLFKQHFGHNPSEHTGS